LKFYRQLKKEISVDDLGMFATILVAVKESYSFQSLLENIVTIKSAISKEEARAILQYPAYIIYFLLPDKKNYPMDSKEAYRKSYQKNILFIYKTIFRKYRYQSSVDQTVLALKTVENLAPYLQEQPLKDTYAFQRMFRDLVKYGLVENLFSDGLCSEGSEKNFGVFGKHGIKQLLRFRSTYPRLYDLLMGNESSYKSIGLLLYAARSLECLPPAQKEIFRELLLELPMEDKFVVLLFLKRLGKIGYFETIVRGDDYAHHIAASTDDSSGRSAKKFLYILITS
jgi:hypothetical protein